MLSHPISSPLPPSSVPSVQTTDHCQVKITAQVTPTQISDEKLPSAGSRPPHSIVCATAHTNLLYATLIRTYTPEHGPGAWTGDIHPRFAAVTGRTGRGHVKSESESPLLLLAEIQLESQGQSRWRTEHECRNCFFFFSFSFLWCCSGLNLVWTGILFASRLACTRVTRAVLLLGLLRCFVLSLCPDQCPVRMRAYAMVVQDRHGITGCGARFEIDRGQ
jgi:hypothetical protein